MKNDGINKNYVMIAMGLALMGLGGFLYRGGYREVGALIVFWAFVLFVGSRVRNLF